MKKLTSILLVYLFLCSQLTMPASAENVTTKINLTTIDDIAVNTSTNKIYAVAIVRNFIRQSLFGKIIGLFVVI